MKKIVQMKKKVQYGEESLNEEENVKWRRKSNVKKRAQVKKSVLSEEESPK